MSKNDGGPAFPCESEYKRVHGQLAEVCKPGMSLRDLFAGLALAGLMGLHDGWDPDVYAVDCYRAADAMLVERETPRQQDELQKHED